MQSGLGALGGLRHYGDGEGGHVDGGDGVQVARGWVVARWVDGGGVLVV